MKGMSKCKFQNVDKKEVANDMIPKFKKKSLSINLRVKA